MHSDFKLPQHTVELSSGTCSRMRLLRTVATQTSLRLHFGPKYVGGSATRAHAGRRSCTLQTSREIDVRRDIHDRIANAILQVNGSADSGCVSVTLASSDHRAKLMLLLVFPSSAGDKPLHRLHRQHQGSVAVLESSHTFWWSYRRP